LGSDDVEFTAGGRRIHPVFRGPCCLKTNCCGGKLCKCEAAANFHRFGIGQIADGDAEVLMATRQKLMQGASQIKIMAGGGGASAHGPIDVA